MGPEDAARQPSAALVVAQAPTTEGHDVLGASLTECMSYGARNGAGAGVVDEMLFDYAAGRNQLVWAIVDEIAFKIPRKGERKGRHGLTAFRAFNLCNTFIEAGKFTRVNPQLLTTPVISNEQIEDFGMLRQHNLPLPQLHQHPAQYLLHVGCPLGKLWSYVLDCACCARSICIAGKSASLDVKLWRDQLVLVVSHECAVIVLA